MAYADRYQHADDIIQHLDTVVPGLADPLLKAKYTGFVAVAAVTVYELAIKEVFIEFAREKNPSFGTFVAASFERINGRIRLDDLKEYSSRFGASYRDAFCDGLSSACDRQLRLNRRDLRSTYSNLVLWRHEFAHAGRVSTSATYEEAVQSYRDGKLVIDCLAQAMH
jgi:hypothetical protein